MHANHQVCGGKRGVDAAPRRLTVPRHQGDRAIEAYAVEFQTCATDCVPASGAIVAAGEWGLDPRPIALHIRQALRACERGRPISQGSPSVGDARGRRRESPSLRSLAGYGRGHGPAAFSPIALRGGDGDRRRMAASRCGAKCATLVADERTATDFDGLVREVEALLGNGWITRGVGKSSYPLHSTLDRAIETRGWDTSTRSARWLEHALLRKFQREAHLAAEARIQPEPSNTMEWLAMMQHQYVAS